MNKTRLFKGIHVVSSDVLQIMSNVFPKITKKELSNGLFKDFKEKLDDYSIDYNELRSTLEPSVNVFAFVFNADFVESKGNYIEPIVNTAINILDKNSKCVFLTGDLIIDEHNVWIYKKIFKESINKPNILFEHNICALVICNISDKTAEKITNVFVGMKAFLFSKNITIPTIEKFALTYCLIQNFIKDGRKLLYSVVEDDDKCNYTFVKIINNNFELCPINEIYYLTFLTARPQQVKAMKEDLKYAISHFFDINNIEIPEIYISNDKLIYVAKSKKILFQKDEIKNLISDAIKSNQIFHISSYEKDPFLVLFNVSIFYKGSKYKVALKWNFASNIISLVTIVYA